MTSGVGVTRTSESYPRNVSCLSCGWTGKRLAPHRTYAGPLPHPCKECDGTVFVKPMDTRTREERFWAKVDQSRGSQSCWPWTSTLSRGGYGVFSVGGRRMRQAHQLAYEYAVGQIPEGLTLDHLCHTRDLDCAGGSGCIHRRCVNPAHLEPVTRATNVRRGRAGQWKRSTR